MAANDIQLVKYVPSEFVNWSQDLRGNLASANACYRQKRKADAIAHLNEIVRCTKELTLMVNSLD